MQKNALFEGRSTLFAIVTTAACSRPGASFSYKNVAKKEWNVYFSLYLKLSTTLQVGTSIIESDMWVKQGKRLYKFLQKYTDYGTETSQLAGYNIVVLSMEKYFCGPASTFHRGNQKSDILYIGEDVTMYGRSANL